MPLPPALAAKLAKRGLIQTSTSASVRRKNKEKSTSDSSDRPRFVEEVIAESYDDDRKGSSSSGDRGDRGGSSFGGGGSQGGGGLLGVGNRKSSGISKFHRMGHYGCPNKSNIHHTCSQFCVTRWGRGKVTPDPIYNRRRLKMLKKYPLPSHWIEIYDPGTGRYYYWNTDTDDVAWMSPAYSKTVVGRAAPEMREKVLEEELEKANKPIPQSNSELMKKSLKRLTGGNKKRLGKDKDELDPMDPAAYSDIPRGNWAAGLRNEANSGVDSTASGPLFQQRPYPSPGDILKANRKPTS